MSPVWVLFLLLFLGSQPLGMLLLASVYLVLLFHLIVVLLSSFCVFVWLCVAFVVLALVFCLGCIPLLLRLHFLRSLLTRMVFLPYAYHVVVFCLFLLLLLWFVFVFLVLHLFLFFVSSVSIPSGDVLCWLLSCPFPFVWFPCFFLRTCSRFDFV